MTDENRFKEFEKIVEATSELNEMISGGYTSDNQVEKE